MSDAAIDTGNKYFVAARANTGEVMIIAAEKLVGVTISKADALLLAAWLVALVDREDEFSKILEAVQNT